MHAIVFTGFLGTGKTTVLLSVVDRLLARGERVVIIENERGAVGVDGPYLQAQGLTVREVRAGCVCCSLTQPLQATVRQLEQAYQPDWLLLEASGVAHADALRKSLEQPAMAGYGWRFVALVDAARFAKLWDDRYGMGTLVRPQVAQADVLVLTKTDSVGRMRWQETAATIREMRPDIAVLPFTPDDAACADMIVRAIEEACTPPAPTPPA